MAPRTGLTVGHGRYPPLNGSCPPCGGLSLVRGTPPQHSTPGRTPRGRPSAARERGRRPQLFRATRWGRDRHVSEATARTPKGATERSEEARPEPGVGTARSEGVRPDRTPDRIPRVRPSAARERG